MTIVRRSTGLGTLLLSVAGLLLCLAGIIGVWAGKGRLDTVATALFGTADDALGFVEVKLDRAKQAVDRSRQRVGGVARIADRLKDTLADVSKECESLLLVLDEVRDELKSAESWLDSSHAIANGVSRVSTAMLSSEHASSHPDSASAAVASRVQEFSAAVADALAKLQAVRQELIELRDKGRLAREVAVGIVARVADVDTRLARLSAKAGELKADVETTRASCVALGQRIAWWIDIAAVILTFVLAWFLISQIGMMKYGWQLARPIVAVAA